MDNQWEIVYGPPEWHVYPLGDTFEHVVEGFSCWCSPDIEDDDMLVMHHAHDQREKYERGERKKN